MKNPVYLALANDEGYPHEGYVDFVDNQINPSTGTIRGRAVFDNAEGNFIPGMFARFTVQYEKHVDALNLPLQALVVEDEQTSVYVVNDNAVSLRKVTTGVESGGRVEILDGLSETDQVVVVGQAALRDGSKVLASNNTATRYSG